MGVASKLIHVANVLLGRSDVTIYGRLYMRRWRLVDIPWLFGVRIHNILLSDLDRDLHDHPFTYLSFILRGGYVEERADGVRTWHGPGSVLFRRAESLHRLDLKGEGDATWTLVFTGPRRRVWGFQTADGWVDWETYAVMKASRGSDPTSVSRYAVGSST